MQRAWRVVMPTLAFLVLGWTWALASPVGSSADENFHLTSSWCAWGSTDSCVFSSDGQTVTVPTQVGQPPCFVGKPSVDASCRAEQPQPQTFTTSHFNRPTGNYPPLFHSVMRALVGPDVASSVVLMRMLNVLIASVILAAALALASPAVRRAIALTWVIAIVPVGLFFIASVNPSSWAIAAGSTFWVFVISVWEEGSLRTRRAKAAVVGAVATGILAVLARSDQAWVLALSLVGVAVLMGFPRRARLWMVLAGAGGIVIVGVLALQFSVGRYLTTFALGWPVGNELNDQPNPLIRVLAEFPAFLAGHVGMQQPWTQRTDPGDPVSPGWVTDAFKVEIGAADITMPSIVGVLGLVCAAGVVFLGLRWAPPRKAIALILLLGGILVQIVTMRALAGWGSPDTIQGLVWFAYPRYTLPALMVAIGIALLMLPASRPLLTRLHAVVVAVFMTMAATVALLATMTRYIGGQDQSWVQLEPSMGWWWAWGPDPVVLAAIGLVAAVTYFSSMLAIGVRPEWPPDPSPHLKSPAEQKQG